MNAYLVGLLGFAALLIGVGAWLGRLVRGSSDFFVAGRALGPVLLLATVLAANIGAGSTVAATGIGYRDGLSAWWWVGSAAIGTMVLALLVGPRIWRIAKQHDLYTVGDFLELRYGAAVRTSVTALLWVGTLAILAGQLIALAVLLNVVVGLPMFAGALIGGVVIMVYFTAGGLAGSAWINAVQLVVLLVGFMIAVAFAVGDVGGVAALLDRASNIDDVYGSFWSGRAAGLKYVALLVPAFIVSPGLIQKVYGARNERAVMWGVGVSGLVLMVFAFAPALLGMVARINHPDLVNSEQALPVLLVSDVPVWVGVLGLGALFAADVSSADAILFMLATSLSQDLYRRVIDPAADDRTVLKVARGAAIVGATLGTVLAILLPSVISALGVFYSLLSVSLFVPVIVGLYRATLGKHEVLWAMGAGISAAVALQFGTEQAAWGVVTPTLLGIGVAVSAATVVTVVSKSRASG